MYIYQILINFLKKNIFTIFLTQQLKIIKIKNSFNNYLNHIVILMANDALSGIFTESHFLDSGLTGSGIVSFVRSCDTPERMSGECYPISKCWAAADFEHFELESCQVRSRNQELFCCPDKTDRNRKIISQWNNKPASKIIPTRSFVTRRTTPMRSTVRRSTVTRRSATRFTSRSTVTRRYAATSTAIMSTVTRRTTRRSSNSYATTRTPTRAAWSTSQRTFERDTPKRPTTTRTLIQPGMITYTSN